MAFLIPLLILISLFPILLSILANYLKETKPTLSKIIEALSLVTLIDIFINGKK